MNWVIRAIFIVLRTAQVTITIVVMMAMTIIVILAAVIIDAVFDRAIKSVSASPTLLDKVTLFCVHEVCFGNCRFLNYLLCYPLVFD